MNAVSMPGQTTQGCKRVKLPDLVGKSGKNGSALLCITLLAPSSVDDWRVRKDIIGLTSMRDLPVTSYSSESARRSSLRRAAAVNLNAALC